VASPSPEKTGLESEDYTILHLTNASKFERMTRNQTAGQFYMVARPLTALSPLKSTAWNSAQNLEYSECYDDRPTPRGAKLAALLTSIITTAVWKQSLRAELYGILSVSLV
jgi:hypothetical protein